MIYRLNNKIPEEVPDDELIDWIITDQNNEVDRTIVEGLVEVSTVFLEIDTTFGRSEKPVVFETMVFGGEMDEYQRRYSTWEEAEIGHKDIVNLVTLKIHNQ